MAKNDIILIDSIIEERKGLGLPSSDKGEVFEFLAMEQILKDYDLSKDELLQGSVDGKDDGGIDSFYIFVNGVLLTDEKDFAWPKSSCELTLYIITCKHADSFRQEVLNSEYSTISELFDFSKKDSELVGSYNSDLLAKRKLLFEAYKHTATNLQSFDFKYIYACRGDENMVAENVQSRSNQIVEQTKNLFSNCDASYSFFGASTILELYRRKKEFDIDLPIKSSLSLGAGNFVVLSEISAYSRFITEKTGVLRKYLFDSNVRDYMGLNPVNSDIMNTLTISDGTDFWWLNNGITILADSAISIGNEIKLTNVQIVNGLQTSRSIFEHFSKGGNPDDHRCVMIKIISQKDKEIRDTIIRSTNNQTAIETKSLFATDKIQRDIEDVMKHSGIYYERRINNYADLGLNPNDVFDIMYLAAAFVGVVLRAPEKAANFKQKFLKDEQKYDAIFNSPASLNIWPVLSKFVRQVDIIGTKEIDSARIIGPKEKCLKRSRYVVSILILARVYNTFNYTDNNIVTLDLASIDKSIYSESWKFVLSKYEKTSMLNRSFCLGILKEAAAKWKIEGLITIERKKNVFIRM